MLLIIPINLHMLQITPISLHMLLITLIIIYMKKLLDFDWLRAVQFKCNTSAKSVTPAQITKN